MCIIDRYYYGEADTGFNKDSLFSVKFTLGFDFPNLPYLINENAKGEIARTTESHGIYRYICSKYNPDLLGKTLEDRGKF